MSASDHVKPIYLGQQPYHTPDTFSSGEEVTLERRDLLQNQLRRSDAAFLHEHREPLRPLDVHRQQRRIERGPERTATSPLFPYYTDDKITEAAETTGSKTVVLVDSGERRMLWQPFSDLKQRGLPHSIETSTRTPIGNKVIFEEVNHDLGLTFQYQVGGQREVTASSATPN